MTSMTIRATVKAAGLSGLLCIAIVCSASAQDEAADRGKAKYEHSCAPCHGRGLGDDGRAMLPGTAALQIKYRGALPPALEDRSDLTYEVVRVFVRNGSWSMPPFRPTELTDDEIRDIAAYLALASRAPAQHAE
jgi:(+)-pinoresinol hydroxylase